MAMKSGARRKPKRTVEQDAAESAVLETIRRARQVFAAGSGTTLQILREADRKLSEKLHAIVARRGAKQTFTEANVTLYRKQVQLATSYLEKRLVGHTHTQAMRAVRIAVTDTVRVAKTLERKFTGITRPLALESQQMQDETIRGAGASLLRRHQSSFQRYGQAMVGDFERVLRGAALEGLTHEQVVSRLVATGRHGGKTAKALHAAEPGYFPEPTSYVKRRYWAERIVRTETAHAHGASALQAMNVTRATEFPDLQKKILAHFDDRTAPDSIAVHGQVRRLEEMFQDGAGRLYLHPPARPNDREVVIPWRPHWENTPSTAPAPPREQAEAELQAQSVVLTQEQRRARLRATAEAARERLRARKPAAAAPQAVVSSSRTLAAEARREAEAQRRAAMAHRRAEVKAEREAARAQRQRERSWLLLERAQERRRKAEARAAERARKAAERAAERARKAAEREASKRKGTPIRTNRELLEAAAKLGLMVEGDVEGIRRILGRDLTREQLGALTGAKALRELGEVQGTLWVEWDTIRYGLAAKGGANSIGGAELSRTITKDRDGLSVYHSYYFTHESVQGGGVGKKVLKGMMSSYRELGIQQVGVSAVDVGQYYWPKLGFNGSPRLVASVRQSFREHLVTQKGLTEPAADAIVSRVETLRDVAITQIGDEKVGKEFLIKGRHDSISSLRLKVKDGDPGWEATKRELGIK